MPPSWVLYKRDKLAICVFNQDKNKNDKEKLHCSDGLGLEGPFSLWDSVILLLSHLSYLIGFQVLTTAMALTSIPTGTTLIKTFINIRLEEFTGLLTGPIASLPLQSTPHAVKWLFYT